MLNNKVGVEKTLHFDRVTGNECMTFKTTLNGVSRANRRARRYELSTVGNGNSTSSLKRLSSLQLMVGSIWCRYAIVDATVFPVSLLHLHLTLGEFYLTCDFYSYMATYTISLGF